MSPPRVTVTTGYVDGAGQTGSYLLTTGWDGVPLVTYGLEIDGMFVSFSGHKQLMRGPLKCRFILAGMRPGRHCDDFELEIFPAIIPAGMYQNVMRSPANGARVRVL